MRFSVLSSRWMDWNARNVSYLERAQKFLAAPVPYPITYASHPFGASWLVSFIIKVQCFPKFLSHPRKRANLREELWEHPILLPVGHTYKWPLETWDWCLRWGLSCGTEPLTCGVCVNSGWFLSELTCIVGCLAGELENWLLMWKNPAHLVLEVWINSSALVFDPRMRSTQEQTSTQPTALEPNLAKTSWHPANSPAGRNKHLSLKATGF